MNRHHFSLGQVIPRRGPQLAGSKGFGVIEAAVAVAAGLGQAAVQGGAAAPGVVPVSSPV